MKTLKLLFIGLMGYLTIMIPCTLCAYAGDDIQSTNSNSVTTTEVAVSTTSATAATTISPVYTTLTETQKEIFKNSYLPEKDWYYSYIRDNGKIFTPSYNYDQYHNPIVITKNGNQVYDEWLVQQSNNTTTSSAITTTSAAVTVTSSPVYTTLTETQKEIF